MTRAASVGSCVAVVDPFSTGGNIAAAAAARGFGVLFVWSAGVSTTCKQHFVPELCGVSVLAEVDEQSTLEATASALLAAAGSLRLAAVIVGGDTGVTLADALSEALGLRTNGALAGGRERRNKRVQQELVRAAGLRAIREAWGTEWHHLEAFVESEGYPVILKPVDGAGSEGVNLCHSKADAEAHFRRLMALERAVGSRGAGVLAQEYLRGREYVVDHVSRDGVHKTVNLALYDKGPCNGAPAVLFGAAPVRDCEADTSQQLIKYTRQVLNALGFKNGPSHGEVILTSEGPCLVEMNCRAHGCDGSWVALGRPINGYSQVDVALDAYFDEVAFASVPDVPPISPRLWGYQAALVVRRAGRVKACPGFEAISKLPSFLSIRGQPKMGQSLPLTVDLLTLGGYVLLLHGDPGVLAADLAAIRAMERDGAIFDLDGDVSESVAAAGGA